MAKTYTEAEKRGAIATYVVCGTLKGAAKATGIPRRTIGGWKGNNPAWWDRIEAEIWDQEEDNLRAGIHAIVVEGLQQGLDRLQNGDERVTTRGEKIRVKMSGRDINLLTGTMYDKLCISLGKPISIVRSEKTSAKDRLAELKKLASAAGDGLSDVGNVVNIEDGT